MNNNLVFIQDRINTFFSFLLKLFLALLVLNWIVKWQVRSYLEENSLDLKQIQSVNDERYQEFDRLRDEFYEFAGRR